MTPANSRQTIHLGLEFFQFGKVRANGFEGRVVCIKLATGESARKSRHGVLGGLSVACHHTAPLWRTVSRARSDSGIIISPERERVTLTPEKVIQIQFQLGSDVMMCLDDCTDEAGALRVWPGTHRQTVEQVLTPDRGPIVPDHAAPDADARCGAEIDPKVASGHAATSRGPERG